jgi:tetratricopeptide (TPR) repeat protein
LLTSTGASAPTDVAAVLAADQWQRWHAGERISAEDYLARHPKVAEDPAAPMLLIYGEFLVREELGEAPKAEEYLARFPQHARALRQQFGFHAAVEAAASVTLTSTTGAPRSTQQVAHATLPGYELVSELGRGGMGVVYKAWQVGLRRFAAVKLLPRGAAARAQDRARFQVEAEAVARLHHPGIVQVYEVGEHEGLPFLAMEFVEGGSLHKKLAGTPLLPALAARLTEALAHAVQAAHDAGIVHRDLKPANILLQLDDCRSRHEQEHSAIVELQFAIPKISDFGLAKLLACGPELTESGAVIGTPSYMAPEQAAGQNRKVGPAADVYALGAILYEMLVGRPPFKAATALDTLPQVVNEEPLVPSQLQKNTPRDLETICLKCLRKEPEKRYASARALADDLRRFQSGEPIQARPVGRVERLAKWVRRRPAVAALSGALALAVIVGFVLVTWKWYEERAARALAESKELEAEQARDAKETARLAALAAAAEAEKAKTAAEQAASRERLANEVAQKRLGQIEKANHILTSVFHDLNPRWAEKGGPPLQAQLGSRLDQAAQLLDGEAVGSPLVVARLQLTLAQTQRSLGYPERAIALSDKARQTFLFHLGDDHTDTLESVNELGLAYWAAGRLDKALPLLQETLDKRQVRLGPDHLDTLETLSNLALVHFDMGQSAKALPLLAETLYKRRASLGEDHFKTLDAMNNLAAAYQADGQLAKALELYEETLDKRKTVLGEDHVDTLYSMNNLATAYKNNKQPFKAIPLLEVALDRMKAQLGPDHPDTLRITSTLSATYRSVGQWAKALPLLEQTLEKQKAKRGPDHLETLITMNNLGMAYRAAGKLDKAVPLLQEALERKKATLSDTHPQTLISLANLALAYQDTGELTKALPLFEEALQQRKLHTGPDHPDTLLVMDNLAAAYSQAQRYPDSAKLLEMWIATQRGKLPADDLGLALGLNKLGACLNLQMKHEEAAKALRESLAIYQKKQPSGPLCYDTESLLGAALAGQKDFASAEPLLLNSASKLRASAAKLSPANHQRLVAAVQRVVDLYEAWDRPDDASHWRNELQTLKSKQPGNSR